ncbi:MAG: hypothetical protein WCO58_00395 [bacterium]
MSIKTSNVFKKSVEKKAKEMIEQDITSAELGIAPFTKLLISINIKPEIVFMEFTFDDIPGKTIYIEGPSA